MPPLTSLRFVKPRPKEVFWDLEPKSLTEALKQALLILAISPMHMDSYNTIARHSPDPEIALDLYQKAISIGDRLWGKKFFKDNTGYFWGIMETRPYMRAFHGLMMVFKEKGDVENTIKYCERMLELSENDNLGMRYILLPILIENNEIEKAEALCKRYDGDYSATWLYSQALLDFRKHGESKKQTRAWMRLLG